MAFLYRFAKPLLFLFDAEFAHHVALLALNFLGRCRYVLSGGRQAVAPPHSPAGLAGIRLNNSVGLAPGFVKDPRYKWVASGLGFGFVEVGTLTRLPQQGNPKPRLFRIKADRALVNRLGFNNPGYHAALSALREPFPLPVAVNLGKNKSSAAENVGDELASGVQLFTGVADWFVVNLSSPNTPGLRALLEPSSLSAILDRLRVERERAAQFWQCRVRPLLLKLHPDLDLDAWARMLDWLPHAAVDGVVVTNTTTTRVGLGVSVSEVERIGAGGLSGPPLAPRRDAMLAELRQVLTGDKTLVAVGGIEDVDAARRCYRLGADAVEVYTGLIYQGPRLIRDLAKLSKSSEQIPNPGNP